MDDLKFDRRFSDVVSAVQLKVLSSVEILSLWSEIEVIELFVTGGTSDFNTQRHP